MAAVKTQVVLAAAVAEVQALQAQIDKVQKEIQTLSSDYAILSK